jgi:hypothetical protein
MACEDFIFSAQPTVSKLWVSGASHSFPTDPFETPIRAKGLILTLGVNSIGASITALDLFVEFANYPLLTPVSDNQATQEWIPLNSATAIPPTAGQTYKVYICPGALATNVDAQQVVSMSLPTIWRARLRTTDNGLGSSISYQIGAQYIGVD